MSHIKHHLHGIAGAMLGPEWRVIARVLDQWPAVVGEAYAAHACPTHVKTIKGPMGQDRARLVVQIPGALAPAFQMMEAAMKERINRIMGYDFIEKIIFEHTVGARPDA